MQHVIYRLIFFSIFLTSTLHGKRSALRRTDSYMPSITTQWKNKENEKIYKLRDSHLEVFPLFHMYDPKDMIQNALPQGSIPFRNQPNKRINGRELALMIENLLKEVRERKKEYTEFTVLKDRDFNVKKQVGLLVARCKKYPFVIKLFMETPKSFIHPMNKGFEPHCFFIIGGGATRHFVGFTRIKNAQFMKQRIDNNPHWSKRVDVPRKWFWTPQKQDYITLTGYKIGGHKEISIDFPSVYAIVADAIDSDRSFSFFNLAERRTAIDLSNFLLCRVDPHINNFMYEKETGKILIIDTEHFPSLVGLKSRPRITTYVSWYLRLFTKYIKDRFLRTKRERIKLQTHPQPPFSAP